jgi:hypothetical protein
LVDVVQDHKQRETAALVEMVEDHKHRETAALVDIVQKASQTQRNCSFGSGPERITNTEKLQLW